ncbi:MAG: HD domain-containing protein [Candidatus Thorarchaeota archaeon]
MIDNNYLSKVRKFALDNSEKDDIHGFNHVERVYNMCIKIGEKLNANLNLLKISALLHDIGRIDEKKDELKRNHAEISAEKAFNYLTSQNFDISKDEIYKIIHCIEAHSFSNNIIPETLEAKILSDADKLDALGAIGLYRTIAFTIQSGGNLDNVIEHLKNKIMKLKNLLFLNISRNLAEKRNQIISDFYNKIRKEK